MKRGIPGRLAWSLAIVSILVMLVGLTLTILYIIAGHDYKSLLSHQSLAPPSTLIYAVLGALVASRHPKNPIGWIFIAVGLVAGLDALAIGYSGYGSYIFKSGSFPGADLANWLDIWVWIPGIILPTTFVFLLFPDGRLLSAGWRLVAWPAGLGLTAVVIGLSLHPGLVKPGGLWPQTPMVSRRRPACWIARLTLGACS